MGVKGLTLYDRTLVCKLAVMFFIHFLQSYIDNLSNNKDILEFAIISFIPLTSMFVSRFFCREKSDANHPKGLRVLKSKSIKRSDGDCHAIDVYVCFLPSTFRLMNTG